MKIREITITVPKSYFNLPDEEFCTYLALKLYCFYEDMYYSMDCLLSTIYGIETPTKNNRYKIRQLIKHLDMVDYREIKQDVFCVSINEPKEQYYAAILAEDFLQIIRSDKKNKFAMIKYLCAINNVAYKSKVSAMPVEYYAEFLGKSCRSIIRYNKDLEEMKILYIVHSKHETNIISLYRNKDYTCKN